jgi:hypothetical protein
VRRLEADLPRSERLQKSRSVTGMATSGQFILAVTGQVSMSATRFGHRHKLMDREGAQRPITSQRRNGAGNCITAMMRHSLTIVDHRPVCITELPQTTSADSRRHSGSFLCPARVPHSP